MNDSHTCRFHRLTAWGLALLCALAGCADRPTAVDQAFGESTRQIRLQQSIHPHDTPTAYPPIVSDGTSGKAGIERFYKSYEAPTPAGNTFNIGVGTPMAGQIAR
jgi:hypothetical protein